MVNIIKQEIEMETALKNRIEFICSFCNTTPTIHNGSIRTIEHTNLNYIEPHKISLLTYEKKYNASDIVKYLIEENLNFVKKNCEHLHKYYNYIYSSVEVNCNKD